MSVRLLCSLAAASMLLAGCGGSNNTATSANPSQPNPPSVDDPVIAEELALSVCDPATANFGLKIDNPWLPLPEGRQLVLEGEEDGVKIRVEIDALDTTETVGTIQTRVVTETEYRDNALYERAKNYFAQAADGTVCYFGEQVAFYENDVIVRTDGSWRAEGTSKPGIQMPATPRESTQFYQEFAPGVAEDRSAIVGVGESFDTPYASLNDVVRMLDWNPLEGESADDGEEKRYATGIGLVGDGPLQLQSYREQLTPVDLGVCDPAITTFTTVIDNPFFPLPVGRLLILEGRDDDEDIRLEFAVTDQFQRIGEIDTRVVTETEFIDGDLFERTFNFFAQAIDGTVCYFGEDVEFYEDGVLVDRRGSWRADAPGNQPGIQMPAMPAVQTQFYQEFAPEQALDKAFVEELNATVQTPAGAFPGSIRTADWNPLDGDSFLDAEAKAYAPGIGLIKDNALLLKSMQ